MRLVAVVLGLGLLGCSGIIDSLQTTVQDKVNEQVEKVDASIQAKVRTTLTDACVKQVGDNERVRNVCLCVADELLASEGGESVLAKLDQPVELARTYAAKCGPLVLDGGEAIPAGGAAPAPAPAPGTPAQ